MLLSLESYDFSLGLLRNEPWRFVTFQFVHLNSLHLIENVVGLLVVGILAAELDVDFRKFLMVYVLSVFIVVAAMALFYPSAVVAGNSTGIYGLLALCAIRSRKLVPLKLSLPLFLFFIFSMSIMSMFSCGMCIPSFLKGEVFHFSGFTAGIALGMSQGIRKRLFTV
jgi:membrane associated rhomboid family serine protease